MLPRLASHTMASARLFSSGLFRLDRASARDFGGSGNAAVAAAVSIAASTTILILDRERTMNIVRVLTILALALAFNAALAADTGGSSTPQAPRDPVLQQFDAAKERQDWAGAATVLKEALSAQPNNADYHNLYAYSLRKGGSADMDQVFKHYNEALRIDPKHRGAHEYIGEAYLMVGNVAKAKEHLGALDKLCFFGCEEYSDLKNAISGFEAKR
jgi:tetratricopeptide (TPR) repeat protein